jgi:hypothetical protein
VVPVTRKAEVGDSLESRSLGTAQATYSEMTSFQKQPKKKKIPKRFHFKIQLYTFLKI